MLCFVCLFSLRLPQRFELGPLFDLNFVKMFFQKQELALKKLFNALKPGGVLLLRDYGRYFFLSSHVFWRSLFCGFRYDEAQLRFGKGAKLEENFYVRQDGTCAYYFDKAELSALVTSACVDTTCAFQEVESFYVTRQYANRQQKKARYRVWLQAKYVKKQK